LKRKEKQDKERKKETEGKKIKKLYNVQESSMVHKKVLQCVRK
jgi:hypothetical protein